MSTIVRVSIVIAMLIAFASASCIRGGGGSDKEDKNVTKAGTDDILNSGIHIKIEISLIYRKRRCMKCLLESMPKLNGLLITYIRGAILLRVVHQAVARLTLLQLSFQFVRFVRMARVQLVVLSRMKWAVKMRSVFGGIDVVAKAMINFVLGRISGHQYVLIYRKYLLKNYEKVSKLLVVALARWKKKPKDLTGQRQSLYGIMMLTHLLWTERYLYERLINYEGSSTVEKDRDDVINKMKGFFVQTKISFKFKRRSAVGSTSSGYIVINGRPVRENKRRGPSILNKWKKTNRKPAAKKSGSSSSKIREGGMLARWKGRGMRLQPKKKSKIREGGMLARWKGRAMRLQPKKKSKKRKSLFLRWKSKRF